MARHFGATRRVNDAWRVEEGGGRMKSGGTFHARALARSQQTRDQIDNARISVEHAALLSF